MTDENYPYFLKPNWLNHNHNRTILLVLCIYNFIIKLPHCFLQAQTSLPLPKNAIAPEEFQFRSSGLFDEDITRKNTRVPDPEVDQVTNLELEF